MARSAWQLISTQHATAEAVVGYVQIYGAGAAEAGREIAEVEVLHRLAQDVRGLHGQHVAEAWEGASTK